MTETRDQMEISQEESQQILQWLKLKGADNGRCPSCGNNHWELATHLVAPPVHANGMIIGGPSYPMYMIICVNCGNTQFFNAVMVGLSRFKKKEAAKAKETDDGVKDG